jgi:hypothetical protein
MKVDDSEVDTRDQAIDNVQLSNPSIAALATA